MNCYIWFGASTSAGADTITATGTLFGFAIYEESGLATIGTEVTYTGTGSSTTGTSATTSAALIHDSNYFAVAVILQLASGHGSVAGGPNFSTQDGALGFSGSIYSSAGLTTSTQFPATWQTNVAWNEVGAVFGFVPAVVTVYQVNACTFFQLQCWWYPMLMFGVGLSPFALVGALGKVNARAMTYLMLFGLTMTALVEVLMGMINVMFPLALTVLTIVYLVRIRI